MSYCYHCIHPDFGLSQLGFVFWVFHIVTLGRWFNLFISKMMNLWWVSLRWGRLIRGNRMHREPRNMLSPWHTSLHLIITMNVFLFFFLKHFLLPSASTVFHIYPVKILTVWLATNPSKVLTDNQCVIMTSGRGE